MPLKDLSAGAPATRNVDAVVVGAGMGGLYMLYRLREMGFSVQVIESGDDVGGTWYWNRYPGARCDIESMYYSFSFSRELQQEWNWTERYAAQPEILRYIQHVAERFNLRPHIQFETRVTSATFDEEQLGWQVKTDHGETYQARFCIMATGSLSAANLPAIEGIETFKGDFYHTAQWPRDGVDLTGKRIGIIGTGSSGVQAIPLLARQASHLYVFQRTPNYCIPARNAPLQPDYIARIKSQYEDIGRRARASASGVAYVGPAESPLKLPVEERQAMYKRHWAVGGSVYSATFPNLLISREENDEATAFIRAQIKATVKDPEVAARLSPKHYLGTKRNCLGTDYYETYNRENVTLVDVKQTPISRLTNTAVVCGDQQYELDCLVLATGFDAMTGSLLRIDIRGRGGVALKDKWADGPKNYLGLMVAGFPNLFIMTGPGTPASLTNFVLAIEHHAEWISDCVHDLDRQGAALIEAREEDEARWISHVNDVADMTLFPTANSWYLGANIPGKPRVFMPYVGGFANYVARCAEAASNGYHGFKLTPCKRPVEA
ncbi:NAD(P)/FAD-dependent oxidoreductase [Pseudomonas silvicola]|nr:NAD(P)/FAD-dependent oxidoreductase [Pseudomonas silvicola]